MNPQHVLFFGMAALMAVILSIIVYVMVTLGMDKGGPVG